MNVKNFLVSGSVGGFIDFLLGWLFYGILFKDQFPPSENMNMLFIFLGCMTFGFLVSYIFNKWAGISNLMSGIKAGAILGLFIGFYSNFFMNAMQAAPNYQNMGLDIVITIASSAIVSGTIAFVIGKLK
ncbi:hypothetical protein [Flavobacterium luteum]|uniref:DUF1761 domain-containing protein n=1 Tax=Flavobacterium luteum TaxID=2026654 RepID=A0A7J5AKA3_9FLAO|nr:hypothetical protein [Flavobacterium luteum]KAB1158037.1 hypothetical protein F6464_02850 [Flavobacterium luteum]